MRFPSLVLAALLAIPMLTAAEQVQLKSPDGALTMEVSLKDGRAGYALARQSSTLLHWAPLGLTIDGVDSGKDVKDLTVVSSRRPQTRIFPVNGVKSQAKVSFMEYQVQGLSGGQTLRVRVFDDGVAFRYEFSAKEKSRVNSESTGYGMPKDAIIWNQESPSALWSSEGTFRANKMSDFKVPAAEELSRWTGDWGNNPYRSFLREGPITAILPDKTYLLLQEAGNFNLDWCGIKYAFVSETQIDVLYFHNRGGFDIGKKSDKTPWRVIIAAKDLNTLVNSDIVGAVVPEPDKKLFPKGLRTDWIRPGRSAWTWWATRGAHYQDQLDFIDMASEFGFEYHLVDEGYEHWKAPEGKSYWDMLEDVVKYGKKKGVKIWIWRHWERGGFNNPEGDYKRMREFFQKAASIGVVGLKIDFMDRDSQDRLRFYDAGLRIGAENKLMINYHGANPPSGEPFTWPNEMSREGIFGLEQNQVGPVHSTALPFTRLVAGHGDYTPGYFGHDQARYGNPSWPLHLAQLIVYTSSVQHVVSNPHDIRAAAPAGSLQREVLKTFPAVWDETVVLPDAEIGVLAPFARRSGKTWYVGVINGKEPRKETIKLDFLQRGVTYKAILIEDSMEKPDDWKVSERTVMANDTLTVEMRKVGGFVARFVPAR